MADTVLSTDEIKSDLRAFLVRNFIYTEDGFSFHDDESFLERGIIDSTGILELIDYLEETYRFSIDDIELIPENLDSVNRVEAFVTRKLAADAESDDEDGTPAEERRTEQRDE